MNAYVRKRDKLLSVVNRLHTEGVIALEEIKSIYNKDYLKSVVCPVLLEDRQITNTIEVEPGNGAKISCRGYLLRQKRYEGSSSCDNCGHIVFKLFSIPDTEDQANSKEKCTYIKVCKACLNEHGGFQISGKKSQKKELPSLTEYLPNGMTSTRASNSWYFVRKDMCSNKSSKRPITYKISCLSDLSDLSDEEAESSMHHKNDLILISTKPPIINANDTQDILNLIIFPSFIDDIPILISPYSKEKKTFNVKAVVYDTLSELIEKAVCVADKTVQSAPQSIKTNERVAQSFITNLLENIENNIAVVIDNKAVNIVDADSKVLAKGDYRLVESLDCENKKPIINDKNQVLLYAGVCSLVTPITQQKGHFIYNASRSSLYNKWGLSLKNDIPKYLQQRKEKSISYRLRKRSLDMFLHKKVESECESKSSERKIDRKKSKDELFDNKNGLYKRDGNTFKSVQLYETCATCKKAFKSYQTSCKLNYGQNTIRQFGAARCKECADKSSYEVLKNDKDQEKFKPTPNWHINTEEITAAKNLNPLKRKLLNVIPNNSFEKKMKSPDREKVLIDLTKPSNVNLIKTQTTKGLDDSDAKSNGKYLFSSSPSSTSSKTSYVSSSIDALAGSDIVINGRSYKIDTEFKLNDLLKDNEAANKLGTSQKSFLTQLPGILRRVSTKKTYVQNKVGNSSSNFEPMRRTIYPVKQHIVSTLSQSAQRNSLSFASPAVRLSVPSFTPKVIVSARPNPPFISIKPSPTNLFSSTPIKKAERCSFSTHAQWSIGSKNSSTPPTVKPSGCTQIITSSKSTSAINIPINQSCKLNLSSFQLKPSYNNPDQKPKQLSASQVPKIKQYSHSADNFKVVNKVNDFSISLGKKKLKNYIIRSSAD